MIKVVWIIGRKGQPRSSVEVLQLAPRRLPMSVDLVNLVKHETAGRPLRIGAVQLRPVPSLRRHTVAHRHEDLAVRVAPHGRQRSAADGRVVRREVRARRVARRQVNLAAVVDAHRRQLGGVPSAAATAFFPPLPPPVVPRSAVLPRFVADGVRRHPEPTRRCPRRPGWRKQPGEFRRRYLAARFRCTVRRRCLAARVQPYNIQNTLARCQSIYSAAYDVWTEQLSNAKSIDISVTFYNSLKVQHLYSAASRICCCVVGAARHRQGRRSPYAAAQARPHALWPAPVQPCVAVVRRFNGLHRSNPCKCMDFYRKDGRLSWL